MIETQASAVAAPTDGQVPAIEARGITKRFPGVLANDKVDFSVYPGEVHAMLGENGAGKSTLMNVLYGLYQPDEGQIFVRGKAVNFKGPNDAIRAGIGMVHQHFMLVPPLTVTENIMLGDEYVTSGVVLDRRRAAARIRELSKLYGLDVDPDAVVRDLPVGTQQRVEILKAFYRNADVLILDEPTAVLTPQEADDLFVIMRSLQQQGKSIVFITHKLREVMAIANRITVLRMGRVVGHTTPAESNEQAIATMMVGRNVSLTGERAAAIGTVEADDAPVEQGTPAAAVPVSSDNAVLRVAEVKAKDARGHFVVNGITFDVRPGEIFGIAGVEGNGQSELIEAITGLRAVAGGQVWLEGVDVTGKQPREMINRGLGYVPEDRQKYGLVLTYPVSDNMVLSTYNITPFAKGIVRQQPAILDYARKLVKRFDVRPPSATVAAGTLSGGNQQKVIIARELSREIRLLIASQPTRGLDVGSIEFIHSQIVAERSAGKAVLLVSAELDEILALADRIGVIYRGRLVAVLPRREATRERLGLLMAGGGA